MIAKPEKLNVIYVKVQKSMSAVMKEVQFMTTLTTAVITFILKIYFI